ncbi:hypothetical protein GJ496_004124 [Pomphorhynchus laevis]|nr:hypothetical protein GJ496_004124 [Pomphorhynchus laevis]
MDNANLIDFFLRFDAYGDLKEFVSKEDNPETYFKSLDIRDIIDFMPIYRGIYVYSKLGNISELSNLYKRDKRKQLFVIMDTTTSSGGNTHQTIALSRFLFKTFGFFIVEDYILNTTSNLIDLGFYSELHSKAVQKITAVCNNSATQTENSEDLLDIKMLLEITCCTVEDYGFNNSFVHDILQEMKAKYFDSLLKKADLQFTKLTDEENYADVVIRCKEDRDKLSSQHKYLLTDIKKDQQYPITLPFSNLVPKIHSEIYDFIDKLKQFYKNFNPNELWAHVRQVIEKLLIEHLDKFFSSLVDDRSRTLTQLIQLCVNAHYLSQYTACLKLSIADIIGISANQMSSDTLSISFGIFTKFYTKSHQKILSQLKISVDQFLELSNYDWMTVESSGMGSPYLIDLLQFFRTTFDSFKTLPTALFFPTLNRTCQHIALNLEHNLFDPEVKAISYPALEQLELDLIQCEQFVVEMCKSNAEIEEAMKSFHILRQLLDLTLTKDWTTYFAEYDLNKQSSKYGAVKSSTALNVVERLKEGLKKYKGITLPFRTKSTDKDEKKLLSTVCEELAKLSD